MLILLNFTTSKYLHLAGELEKVKMFTLGPSYKLCKAVKRIIVMNHVHNKSIKKGLCLHI